MEGIGDRRTGFARRSPWVIQSLTSLYHRSNPIPMAENLCQPEARERVWQRDRERTQWDWMRKRCEPSEPVRGRLGSVLTTNHSIVIEPESHSEAPSKYLKPAYVAPLQTTNVRYAVVMEAPRRWYLLMRTR